jgi:hypothetical protein
MKFRAFAAAVPIAAVVIVAAPALAGCDTDSTSSSPSRVSTDAPLSTAVSTTTSSPNSPGPQQQPTSAATQVSSKPTNSGIVAPTQVPGHDVDGSGYSGIWQRHESRLTLDTAQSGSLLIGSNAVDGETWSLTWEPEGAHIVITLGTLLGRTGAGLDGYLHQGQVITGELVTDTAHTMILRTHGTGTDNSDELSWCSQKYGSSPECGA